MCEGLPWVIRQADGTQGPSEGDRLVQLDKAYVVVGAWVVQVVADVVLQGLYPALNAPLRLLLRKATF